MKKLALILAILISVSHMPLVRANAENLSGSYARIVADDCAFFSDASLKIVKFYLPKTYCVKIVSVGAECSRVVYMDGNLSCPMAEGYVKNVYLSFLDEEPEVIYPALNLASVCDEVIFGDTTLSKPKAVIPVGSSAVFYGAMNINGNEYEYVYVNGYVGYMRKECFAPFNLPLLEIPVKPPDSASSTDTAPDDKEIKSDFTTPEVLIIAVIVIAGLSLVFFMLKPTKEKSQKGFNDDN